MSDKVERGTYVWARFAQTVVHWPGRLDSIDDRRCLIWVESEQQL